MCLIEGRIIPAARVTGRGVAFILNDRFAEVKPELEGAPRFAATAHFTFHFAFVHRFFLGGISMSKKHPFDADYCGARQFPFIQPFTLPP